MKFFPSSLYALSQDSLKHAFQISNKQNRKGEKEEEKSQEIASQC